MISPALSLTLASPARTFSEVPALHADKKARALDFGPPSPGPERFSCSFGVRRQSEAATPLWLLLPAAVAPTKKYLQSEPADGPPSPGGCGENKIQLCRGEGEPLSSNQFGVSTKFGV